MAQEPGEKVLIGGFMVFVCVGVIAGAIGVGIAIWGAVMDVHKCAALEGEAYARCRQALSSTTKTTHRTFEIRWGGAPAKP